MTETVNLWDEIGNICLKRARAILDGDSDPNILTIKRVKGLVGIAISIDELNLRWAERNRSGAEKELGKLPHASTEVSWVGEA